MTLDQESTRPEPVHAAEAVGPVQMETADLRRLHPLTPLFRSWRLVGFAGALGFGAFRDDLSRLVWIWHALHGDAEVGIMVRAFLLVLAAALLSVGLGWLSWRATGFAIVAEPGEPGTLLVHRGLFVRQRSQVRLKRVQSVDVNQPFVPRLFGLAAVKLDMAAGEGASVNLSYLGAADAWALREEILRHTSVSATAATAEPADDAVIAHVSTPHLIKANLLDSAGIWLLFVAWVVGVIVVALVFGSKAFLASLTGIIPVTLAILVQLRQQVASMLRDADFTLMRTPTGIRTRSGLTSTTNRTIDLDRIQGVRVEEPYLWRRFGWARVRVDIAGAADDANGASLMPVADREPAMRLAADVTGESLHQAQLVGPGAGAKKLDPVVYRNLGVALLEAGALTRTGWWTRTLTFVPYARVQSVSVRQGWLQRRLGLATVYLDLPSGAHRWEAPHRDVADAAALVTELTERARALRRSR
ncbi:MAG: PH domain-containing protein [Nocardioidaceae bacterium]